MNQSPNPVTVLAGLPPDWQEPLIRHLPAGTHTVCGETSLAATQWSEQGATTLILAALSRPTALSLDESLGALQVAAEHNTKTPMRLLNAILPGMISRGEGKIVLVTWNSTSCPVPRFAAAASTSRAIAVYAESLRPALKLRGIQLSTLLLEPAAWDAWQSGPAAESVSAAISACWQQGAPETRLRV